MVYGITRSTHAAPSQKKSSGRQPFLLFLRRSCQSQKRSPPLLAVFNRHQGPIEGYPRAGACWFTVTVPLHRDEPKVSKTRFSVRERAFFGLFGKKQKKKTQKKNKRVFFLFFQKNRKRKHSRVFRSSRRVPTLPTAKFSSPPATFETTIDGQSPSATESTAIKCVA